MYKQSLLTQPPTRKPFVWDHTADMLCQWSHTRTHSGKKARRLNEPWLHSGNMSAGGRITYQSECQHTHPRAHTHANTHAHILFETVWYVRKRFYTTTKLIAHEVNITMHPGLQHHVKYFTNICWSSSHSLWRVLKSMHRYGWELLRSGSNPTWLLTLTSPRRNQHLFPQDSSHSRSDWIC